MANKNHARAFRLNEKFATNIERPEAVIIAYLRRYVRFWFASTRVERLRPLFSVECGQTSSCPLEAAMAADGRPRPAATAVDGDQSLTHSGSSSIVLRMRARARFGRLAASRLDRMPFATRHPPPLYGKHTPKHLEKDFKWKFLCCRFFFVLFSCVVATRRRSLASLEFRWAGRSCGTRAHARLPYARRCAVAALLLSTPMRDHSQRRAPTRFETFRVRR